MEFDTRRLYLQEGCSSLFTYCTQVLRLSEHAAYGRIEAARTARKFPLVLEHLIRGDVTLTNVSLLARHLTPENHAAVLAEARHKSKREVEQIVARLQPQPDVPSMIRQLPAPRAAMPQPQGAGHTINTRRLLTSGRAQRGWFGKQRASLAGQPRSSPS
jgi:hypothetical protein